MSHLLSGGEPVHLGGGGVRNFAGKLLGWSEINNPWNRGGGGGGGGRGQERGHIHVLF